MFSAVIESTFVDGFLALHKNAFLTFLGRIAPAAQATLPAATHFSVMSSVCLSVCYIHVSRLNRSTDLGEISD